MYKTPYWIFNCIFCHEIYYTDKIIKAKKCLKCNKKSSFKESIKIKVFLTPHEMIILIQKLKELNALTPNFNFLEYCKNLKQ